MREYRRSRRSRSACPCAGGTHSARKGLGKPVRGTALNTSMRNDMRPVCSPSQRTSSCRTAPACAAGSRELVHQVDAELVVVDPDVDVQATQIIMRRAAPCISSRRDVAFLVRALLAGGGREGMRRCGDGREAEATGCLDHGRRSCGQLLPRFGDVAADRCREHLRQGTRGRHAPPSVHSAPCEAPGWIARYGPGLAVDEQVFLLDTRLSGGSRAATCPLPIAAAASAGSSSIGPISFARRRTQRSVPAGDSNWSWRISDRRTANRPTRRADAP